MNHWKKNIILFLSSQTISLFGSSLVQYAIMWYITLRTQSGVMMTISILCGFLPTFFLSPFGGVWADRYNRKLLIILADSTIALATLLLAILFTIGYDMLWLLFAMSAIRALGSAVQTPAIGAFLPQIVPQDKLMKVNGTNGSIQSLVMLVSPMASGALLTVSDIKVIFYIDVVTAAMAIATLLLFLHVPAHEKAAAKQTTGYFRDLQEGYQYIKNHSYLKRFFLFCAVLFLLASPVAFLTPLQVSRTFGNDVWRLTAIEIAFSAGMMVGGLLMAYWGGFRNKIYTMALGGFIIGVGTIALGVIPDFFIYSIVMGVVGVAMPVFNTPSTVLLQQKVEQEFLGRVFGILTMISSSMMPLGMLAFGPLADAVKIEWMLIATGILMSAEIFFLLKSKVIVEAGETP